ncbi:EAL domain-containing protein [Anaerosinus gibii]|uniref:EAL domain-containing protein n=1 Tax=Selenobaculum gibii TaxID=3054208 RepID=A0A9Y2ESC4_9FIRM|nr:EAL domain-containing protein [Selenobaculum gbiensis]WIW70186.1 EAL domain-containing protein [Selenobaculum gbiensis]
MSETSSLNLLKDIPIDVLKLDKGLFRQDKSTQKEHIILESIVDMAHKLDMKVVAEGVENIYQVNFLNMID